MKVTPSEKSNPNHQHQDQAQKEGLHIAVYLSYSACFDEMGDRIKIRKDEYDLDWEDTKSFAVQRYNDIIESLKEDLYFESDRKMIMGNRNWQTIQSEIQRKRRNPELNSQTRRLLNSFQPLPRTLNDLTQFFQQSVDPLRPSMEPLWGLVFLNIQLACASVEKLRKTAEWIGRLRRAVELFNRCLEVCNDIESKEARITIVDVFDPLLSAFGDSIKYLRNCERDQDVIKGWTAFEAKIGAHISELDGTVKHLNEMTNLSAANRVRFQKNLEIRHGAVHDPEEPATWPIQMLPLRQNPRFYGRTAELEKINEALDWKTPGSKPLRTFTIYGRRGVGKTELALEYAYSNPAKFDVIFWVGCETGLILRQSFSEMAVKLNLPGAAQHGHHEENQLNVLKWLKLTKARWLMIFDNAEKEQILKGYWPIGANGAILITSRKYYNFMKDDDRKGITVSPFNPKESFDLLCQFLGEDVRDLQQKRLLKRSEVDAAKDFLARLEGLALAIQQAAILIKNDKIGGPTIETTFDLFKEHAKSLPPRQAGSRSDTYHSLDTLWDMNFRQLPKDARQLLSVLSLLSPDTTYIELFLPRRQAVLNGKLVFCKQQQNIVNEENVTLTNVLTPTQALEDGLAALVRAELIKREGRIIFIHRVVQEAMNYYSVKDLQESFDAAVRIVAEAFPKRRHGIALFEQWAICSLYIHDAVHLINKFSEYTRPPIDTPRLIGSNEFIEMIGNCAWYLYEVSDYDGALHIIDIGYFACKDKESLSYADLCNTAGVCYLEKNLLNSCRVVLETSLRIREEKLPLNDIEIAAVTHNIGNLETATGDYDRAMEYFNRALEIRLVQGDTAANQLALLYLCIGRVDSLRRDYDKAARRFNTAENLFVRTLGAERHYMAHVHYAYGNLEYRKSNWLAARRCYTDALRIANAETPIHPITAAALFSLGCTEFKLKHEETAKAQLKKAQAIAELRSPTRVDGPMARIYYMQSVVLANDPLTAAQADQLRTRAEIARNDLVSQGESAMLDVYDADGNLETEDEGAYYDGLVPIFFR